MEKQKQKRKNSNTKEQLIVTFVIVSALLIITDVGKNLMDEIHVTSELKTLSTEPVQPQPVIESTLTEEEMKAWAENPALGG